MSCGGSSFGGCSSYSFIGSGSNCGRSTSLGSCVSTPCGGSLGSEMISRLVHTEEQNTPSISTKRVFVYDINLDTNTVSCLREVSSKGAVLYSQKEVEIDKLRKFVKKGECDVKELVGMSVKKDGTFKIKTKELKPYASLLKEKIPNYKEHLSHLKEVKRQLKEERENEGMEM